MPKSTKKSAAKQKKVLNLSDHKIGFLSYRTFSKKIFYFLSLHRSVYSRFLILLFLSVLLITGTTQYGSYKDLSSVTTEISGQISGGFMKQVVEIGIVFTSLLSGSLLTGVTESQQLLIGIIYLLTWLTCVWLARSIMAGHVVALRDGLYSSGAPLIATLLVCAFAIVQLLPLALLVSLVSVVASTGALNGWLLIPAFLVILLAAAATLYWLTSTFFAAIIVTIPGTYPWKAVTQAKSIVTGFRLHIIKRVVWLSLLLLLASFAFLVPVIALDVMLGYPFSFLVVGWVILVGAAQLIFTTNYIYMMYREVIDEHA